MPYEVRCDSRTHPGRMDSNSLIAVARDNMSIMGERMPRIAVHAHVFYSELWGELWLCIRNYIDLLGEENVHLYVTYPKENKELADRLVNAIPFAVFCPVPNLGYDIGPFIEVLHHVNLSDFDYFVKVHTKRDVKDGWVNFRHYAGGEWRKRLLSFCMTKEAVLRSLHAFDSQPDLGMVADGMMIDPSGIASCNHRDFSDSIVRELGLTPRGRTIVWGTMFMVRARLLEPFLRLKLEDFSSPSKIDPHKIEGMASRVEGAFGMVVNALGYRVSDGRGGCFCATLKALILRFVYTIMRYASDILRSIIGCYKKRRDG